MLKRKNMKLASDIEDYVKANMKFDIENIWTDDLVKSGIDKLVKNLNYCAIHTLYEMDYSGKIKLMTPKTCNHRLCNICNWNRQKKIRRKYFRWFETNQNLCKIADDALNIKYCTNAQLEKYVNNGFKLVSDKIEYDLMHLTLTVPHNVKGWRGRKYYFSEIMQAYNDMRHYEEWNKFVYGGEYGVETTKNDSGYHTHIHSLVFVKKGSQNRNLLHLNVLQLWNKLTVDSTSERIVFVENQRAAIKKGNQLITDVVIDKLHPQGATLIGLECLYTTQNGIKSRSKEWGSEDMIKGVMETISYHFKPRLFNTTDHSFDLKTIFDMLPKVHGKVLYRKFGVLHKEVALNVKDNTLLQDFEETTEEVDEETGEVFETQYFITNPLNVYAKGVNSEIALSNRADVRIHTLRSHSGREAIQELNKMIVEK
jgi:hypothetical protein